MDAFPGSSKSTNNAENVYRNITSEFENDIIKETLRLHYRDTKTKITEEALELVKEITKAMVVESAMRAAKHASFENKSTAGVNHVETMLLQMMLDFP